MSLPLQASPVPPTLTQQQEFQFPAFLFFLFQQNLVDLLVDSGSRLLLVSQTPGTAAPGQGPGHGERLTSHQVTLPLGAHTAAEGGVDVGVTPGTPDVFA